MDGGSQPSFFFLFRNFGFLCHNLFRLPRRYINRSLILSLVLESKTNVPQINSFPELTAENPMFLEPESIPNDTSCVWFSHSKVSFIVNGLNLTTTAFPAFSNFLAFAALQDMIG